MGGASLEALKLHQIFHVNARCSRLTHLPDIFKGSCSGVLNGSVAGLWLHVCSMLRLHAEEVWLAGLWCGTRIINHSQWQSTQHKHPLQISDEVPSRTLPQKLCLCGGAKASREKCAEAVVQEGDVRNQHEKVIYLMFWCAPYLCTDRKPLLSWLKCLGQ